MTFRRVNRIALKRLAGRAEITPPGGEVHECRALFGRPYDDGHSSAANVQRPDPQIHIDDQEPVDLAQGSAVKVWDIDDVFIGDFTIQRAQPDEDHSGLMRVDLRKAKS